MEVNDSSSSHAICESAEASDGENTDILVKQLDISVLMAALLEEKCALLEQDGDKGHKLFVDVYNYLLKHDVVKPLSSERESLLHMQKQVLDNIVQTMAQNAKEKDLSGAYETTSTTAQYAAQTTRYRKEFQQIKLLGQGGFGKVYEAKHNLDGENYAVKKILLEHDSDIAKTLREVRAHARLKHRNIVDYNTCWVEEYPNVSAGAGTSSDESEGSSESFSTSDSDENAGQEPVKNIKRQPVTKDKQLLCIQMELCNCTLHNWLEERNRTSGSDYETLGLHPHVKHIFHGILRGVIFLHSKGLMHRDLKPQNIFLTGCDLHVKIGDFGLIKSVNGSDSICSSPTVEGIPVDFNTTTRDIGSKMYGSPELLNGQKCDTKCDVYSLGIMLFEMCSTFTTGMERFEILSELREKNRCSGNLRRIWSDLKIQLIEELINPVAELRPTAEEVLKHPLFDSKHQTLQQTLFSIQVKKDKNLYQKGQEQDQKPKEQVQKPKEQDHKPKQQVQKPKEQVQKPKEQVQKPKEQVQKPKEQVKKPKEPVQKPKEQVQADAVELPPEASADAQLMGFANKKKKK